MRQWIVMVLLLLVIAFKWVGSVADSSDNISVVVLEKDGSHPNQIFRELVSEWMGSKGNSLHSECGFSLNDGDQDTNFGSEEKNLTYNVAESKKLCGCECTACDKSFNSYQVLGGHRASLKKIKEGSSESPQAEELELHNYSSQSAERQRRKSRDHECSICGKVFRFWPSSRRSHLVAANNTASAAGDGHASEKASKLGLLDLNLLARDDERSCNSNGSIECWI